MKKTLRILCLISILPIQSLYAETAIFEDFSDSMSVQKFNGTEQTMEINSDGELALSSRAKSYLQNDPQSNNRSLNGSEETKTLSADLKVTEVSLGNSTTQQAILRIYGRFYSIEEGYSWVSLNMGDRGNGLEAWYEVFNLLYDSNDNYVSATSVKQGSLSLGNLSLNTSYPASITYDGNTNFTFVFNNGSPVTVSGSAKTGDAIAVKAVATRLRFGQNNSTPALYEDEKPEDGTTASISGTVDNVTTDIAGLGDNFSSGNLDKWNKSQETKEITDDGQLQMAISQTGNANSSSRVYLTQLGLKYLGAKITLSSESTLDTARVTASIGHNLGNDTYDVKNGDIPNKKEGNLWATFTLERYSDERFKLSARISRIDTHDHSAKTKIISEQLVLATPFELDVQYELAIEQIGQIVNYNVDGENLFSYDLATSDLLTGNLYSTTGNSYSQLDATTKDGPGRVIVLFDDITTNLVPNLTLNGTNSEDEQVALPKEVIVHVGELVTLIANTANPSDVIKYIWEQVSGTEVVLPSTSGKKLKSTALAKVISSENQISFTVPDGSDTENLAFKVTTIDKSGLESEETFTLAVDNSKESTLSPEVTTPDTTPETTSSSGGSLNFNFILLLLLTFTSKLMLHSRSS